MSVMLKVREQIFSEQNDATRKNYASEKNECHPRCFFPPTVILTCVSLNNSWTLSFLSAFAVIHVLLSFEK